MEQTLTILFGEEYMTILIISAISNIIAIVVAGAIASNKGVNTVGWSCLAIPLSWIAVIIVACIQPQRRSHRGVHRPFYNSTPVKIYICPHCGQEVKTRVCLYCGKENDFHFE